MMKYLTGGARETVRSPRRQKITIFELFSNISEGLRTSVDKISSYRESAKVLYLIDPYDTKVRISKLTILAIIRCLYSCSIWA
jgi:hypothetical protein